MNLQDNTSPWAITSSTEQPHREIDAVAVLYSVFKTIRVSRLSRKAFTAALMSIDVEDMSITDKAAMSDSVRVAGAIFRSVVLYDSDYLPCSMRLRPPFRYGTGRTLWESPQAAARQFVLLEWLGIGVRDAAMALVTELMQETGFVMPGNCGRRVKTGAANRTGRLLSRTRASTKTGGCEVISIVKFVGDRDFTILRHVGDADAVGCEEVTEQRACDNEAIFHALGCENLSTLQVCVEFGMLQDCLIV